MREISALNQQFCEKYLQLDRKLTLRIIGFQTKLSPPLLKEKREILLSYFPGGIISSCRT